MGIRLALVVVAVTAAGCQGDDWETQPVGQVEVDGARLIVGVHCHPDARATATESNDTIEVTFEVSGDYMGDCYDVATVELERPLGDRQVLDASTGEPVLVGPHL